VLSFFDVNPIQISSYLTDYSLIPIRSRR
jgi:hypothetical protein